MSWLTSVINSITGKEPEPSPLRKDEMVEKPGVHVTVSDGEALLRRGQETGRGFVNAPGDYRAPQPAKRGPVIVDPANFMDALKK